MRFLFLLNSGMVDLFQKRLNLVFEDGFLISTTFSGPKFHDDPRFFDKISIFSIFGKPDTIPIEGVYELYYEKVEVDAFRKFLINWEPEIAEFDPDNLPITDVPKILDVVKEFTFEEKRDALSLFYGSHYIKVRELLSKLITEIPNQEPYEIMINNMRNLRELFTSDFEIEDFKIRITELAADALFNYWISSSMNFTTGYFGGFGRWPAHGLLKNNRVGGVEINLRDATLKNTKYRKILYTDENSQLVLMSIEPEGGVPIEIHEKSTQFIQIEQGRAEVNINKKIHNLRMGETLFIPMGAEHAIINISEHETLKLNTIYSPPVH